ncbi:Retrovirus-related Pol polyprotein from transposon RE1 [Sesamum angolense]|uniref:Retrovirus-related Pol polyprotein from transposon RE1 n=1 Tax=Sesamum angolense TaxID=2727404 RepID=A0AAE1T5K3_9LAMI|nr:Retrovirus-related Pol polyprotein from transposon RE1 [Sesamum angolense]
MGACTKPENSQPVTCKWVYRLKKKSDGTIDRYKARLVARGFSQSYGLDYEETFSPVAKMVTVRSIFSLAAFKNWKIWQLDVKNAFLYGELDREVLMEQPPGFVSEEFPTHVCLLKKALYGLKQAPRAWYGKVAQYFIFCGFRVADSDSSLFVKTKSKGHLLVLLYVDDMLITGENEAEISCLRNDLSVRFEMKNLGEIGCFLGLEVKKTGHGFFISQRSYAKNLLDRFGMGESNGIATPMEPYLKLNKEEGQPLRDERKFRQLVGSLIYLTTTRPEIAFSVSVISQFMQSPRSSHLDAAKRILRYIKGSLDYGLLYKNSNDFKLKGFTDADWVGDASDRRSTSGYCFNIGSAVVSWCSKKQSTVALSSTEAEYMAATIATQECIWLKRLIGDIYGKVNYTVPIECDNESAIRLASNPVFHGRTKHVEIHHHFVREKVLNQEVELKGIHTNDQVADIFTKALAKPKFESFRTALGVIDINLGESEVGIKDVKFINVRGTSDTEVAVDVQCSKVKPCQDIQFVGLDLITKGTRQPTTASCSNADHELALDKFLHSS